MEAAEMEETYEEYRRTEASIDAVCEQLADEDSSPEARAYWAKLAEEYKKRRQEE